MRYYKIILTDDQGKPKYLKSLAGMELTSLLTNGQSNPAALNIELDLPIYAFAQPSGQALVTIWGPSLQDIGSAADFNGLNIEIYGGMAKGLPLANPAQSGLLLRGTIYQAFGNWIGTDQSLCFIVYPAIGTPGLPSNVVFNWTAGTPMSAAIAATLTTAFPGVPQKISISPRLVLQHDEVGYNYSLSQFADLVKRLSIAAVGGSGVDIAYNGAQLVVADGTTPAAPKQIAPQDLIGQPTWLAPQLISIKFVMRADLDVLDAIMLPRTIIQNTQASLPQFRNDATFSGSFTINYLRHIGNFRQPDAASWNTTVEAFPTPVADRSDVTIDILTVT